MIDPAGHKTILVATLRELLSQLPDDAELVVNAVHNLSILNGTTHLGTIDLATEEIVLWSDLPASAER